MKDVMRRWRAAGASRPAIYLLLSLCVATLTVVGAVMVLSASSVESLADHGSAWYVFRRQLIWIVLGVTAFIAVARLDYHWWRKVTVPMLAISIGLLLVVLIPGIGVEVSGSRRWLELGFTRFQPSEFAKLAVLVFVADVVARRHRDLGDPRAALLPVGLVSGVIGLLVLVEPDLDSVIVLALIVLAVLIVGGVPRAHIVKLVGSAVAVGAALAWVAPYRRARVLSFLDPWSDAANTGYQTAQSLIAIGSGGVFGVGLGAGRSKWLFLPNAHTDFIFAVIAEELGLVGALSVVALFIGMAVIGVMIAARAPDRFGLLLAAGITVWIVGQAAINIGMVVGMLPVSGLPLPFVSLGGSATVVTMVAVGILANVARQRVDPAKRGQSASTTRSASTRTARSRSAQPKARRATPTVGAGTRR